MKCVSLVFAIVIAILLLMWWIEPLYYRNSHRRYVESIRERRVARIEFQVHPSVDPLAVTDPMRVEVLLDWLADSELPGFGVPVGTNSEFVIFLRDGSMERFEIGAPLWMGSSETHIVCGMPTL